MECGKCGSGITAQEKYKELDNGHTAKYIYYGCTRSKDLNCKERYIREVDLIEQVIELIDDIDLEEAGLKKKLKSEVEKYYKFQNIFGEGKKKLETKEADMKRYAKHVLKEENILKKRKLMKCLKSNLILESKELNIQN